VKKQLTYAGLAVVILGAGSYAVAQGGSQRGPQQVSADLNGYQEAPSISTTGDGSFTATIDDENRLIMYELSYSGLEGTTTAQAHIHLGQRSVVGGVSAFLCGGGDKPPCPPTSGTVEGVIDPADVIGPAGQGIAAGEFEELVRAMRDGHAYANVHTNKHPGGEIRGQIHDPNQREVVR
jgi:hypothetical protein